MHRRRVVSGVLRDLSFLAEKPIDENARGVDIRRAFENPHFRNRYRYRLWTMVADRRALDLLLVGAVFRRRYAGVEFTGSGELQHSVHPLAAQLRFDVVEQLGEEVLRPFFAVGLP